MKKYILATSLAVLTNTVLRSQDNFNFPVTAKVDELTNYHGTNVEDPYRWLEDDRSKATLDWGTLQNKATQTYLQNVKMTDAVRNRLKDLWNFNKQTAPFKKGNHFFCYKNNGIQNQNVLYIKKSLEDEGTVLLDPNALSADGTVSLNGISISRDAKTMAYGLSTAGSDWVEIHFMDIATKKEQADVLKWVKFSDMSWRGNGIYYSRYAEPTGSGLTQKNQFHKVYYHRLGTKQDEDQLVFEDKASPDSNFGAYTTGDEKYLFISTRISTSGEKLAVKDLEKEGTEFVTIADDFDNDYQVIDNIGSTIYMLTNRKASNYKLVSFTMETSSEQKWKTVLPEGKYVLEGVNFCNNKIIANYLENVVAKMYCYSMEGKLEKQIRLPGICKLSGFNSDKAYNFATYSIQQFIAPEQTYYLDAATWESKLLFTPNCSFDSKSYVTEQVFYSSKDGTRVPMFITHKKGLVMNESTPCFVYGYGGFNISIAPEFRIDRTVFLESGGIYCVPNIRGGGEYGENWHEAGTKCKKQNVFNDFIAACDYLVSKKYTSYQKIAIHGRSNGGLLVGAVMTQRPDICKVAIPAVGVLDMLRFHLFTIGRAWTHDYGCSENKDEFECLYKYSPLHNIKETEYPATLILTGDHDDRVVPAHSFKFAATLQEKNRGKEPVLIRIDVNAGHGAGKPTAKQIDEAADMWSFVLHNLEVNL